MRSRRNRLLLIGGVTWALLLLAVLAVLYPFHGQSEFDLSCEVPGRDSNYAPSEWQWWPPGRVCVHEGRQFDRPSWRRGAAVIVLALGGTGLVVASARKRSSVAMTT